MDEKKRSQNSEAPSIWAIITNVEVIKEYARSQGQEKHSNLGFSFFSEIKGGH